MDVDLATETSAVTSRDGIAEPVAVTSHTCAAGRVHLAGALDRQLAALDRLEDRLIAITAAIPGRVAFSTSLGLEDQVVLHADARTGASVDVFTLDTGRHFPETLETLDLTERAYGLRIRVVVPDARELEGLMGRDGVFGFRRSIDNRKACCEVRKVGPLRRALRGAAGWITGVRRQQSAGRAEVPLAVYEREHGLVKLNPLADWSLDRLETYVASHDIPVNVLHARGFPSIGCQPCTRAVATGEDIRAGRWWWESQGGKECGLHGSRTTEVAG